MALFPNQKDILIQLLYQILFLMTNDLNYKLNISLKKKNHK